MHSSTMPAGSKPQIIDLLGNAEGEFMFIWARQDPHVPLAGRKLRYNKLNDPELTGICHRLGHRPFPPNSTLGIE